MPPMEEITANSLPPLPTVLFDLVVGILWRFPVKSLLQLRCVCKTQNSLISVPSTSNPPPPLPTLPFDLVVEILSRLPVKSLLQLRCVCKSWNSLISDPKFAKKHLRCSTKDSTRHHILLDHLLNTTWTFISWLNRIFDENSWTLISWLNRIFDENVVFMAYQLQSVFNTAVAAPATLLDEQFLINFIVGSCDGILCLDMDQGSLLLWNPSLRRFKKLPSLENPPLEEEEHCECYTTHGFGYDHLADRYKVVAVFVYNFDNKNVDSKTQVKVHTLGTDSWRSIQEFPLGVTVFDMGKFVSGTLNWLAHDSTNLFVVSFDLGKESYHEIFLPVTGELVWGLGVLRECLCTISYLDGFADIWLMKEYGNKDSWTQLFSMKMMEELDPYPNLLHISEDGEVLLLQHREKLVLYNSRDATFKTPQILDLDSWMSSVVYVESLISP